MLREEVPEAPVGVAPDRSVLPADAGMFERLRAWRSGEARAQKVPPYVIFHDAVLREIADLKPADLRVLGGIKGVGSSKLERYGEGILEVLRGSASAPRQGPSPWTS